VPVQRAGRQTVRRGRTEQELITERTRNRKIFMPAVSEKRKAHRSLWLVSLAVFMASSVWFAGTAAAPALKQAWSLTPTRAAWLTLTVQAGFILGTLLYALFNIPDLFNARKVFCISAGLGAVFNAGFAYLAVNPEYALIFRFLTGVTLAGVYPVGMRIIAQWFEEGLGWGLGVMVGALTLGTAAPYGFFAIGADIDWRHILIVASVLAAAGGAVVGFGIKDGPYRRDVPPFDARAAVKIFRIRRFRLQAMAYFGHMWELYAFWALVGSWMGSRLSRTGTIMPGRLALATFAAIAFGAAGCLLGGAFSRSYGERRVALAAIVGSGILCAVSGWLYTLPSPVLLAMIFLWGGLVVADSPQFSAMAARFCPPRYTGTALTIQNGIGFTVTLASIQVTSWLAGIFGWRWALTALSLGPILGAAALIRLKGQDNV